MKTLFYIAGPYSAPTRIGVIESICEAIKIASKVRKAGYAAIVPHLESMFSEDSLNEAGWLEHDIELLSRCDAVIVGHGWETSIGTQVEIEEAECLKIPVYFWPDVPFLKKS